MDIHEAWERALKQTEIIRTRVSPLQTFSDTQVPYILLAASSINEGDTVVRRGEVVVQKPSLILPPNIPRFEGFEFQKEEGVEDSGVMSFLYVRGISLPSLNYNNKTSSLDIYEGDLAQAVGYFANTLERSEDTATGLMTGGEDNWQFSLLIFICTQIARNTGLDIKRLMDDYKKLE